MNYRRARSRRPPREFRLVLRHRADRTAGHVQRGKASIGAFLWRKPKQEVFRLHTGLGRPFGADELYFIHSPNTVTQKDRILMNEVFEPNNGHQCAVISESRIRKWPTLS